MEPVFAVSNLFDYASIASQIVRERLRRRNGVGGEGRVGVVIRTLWSHNRDDFREELASSGVDCLYVCLVFF